MVIGPVALAFGALCAAVCMIAAFCRSHDALRAALACLFTWSVTKVLPAPYNSAAGIMLDAFCCVVAGGAAIYLVYRRKALIWPRIMASSQLIAAFLVVLWAALLNAGLHPPRYPYALALNLLYLVALLSVLSLGLHDGAISVRAWLSRHHHDGSWSRPGSRWGRTAEKK